VPLFRWVLLLLGIVIIAGVFAYSRGWFALPKREQSGRLRHEPVLDDDPVDEEDWSTDSTEAAATTESVDDVQAPELSGDSLVITVRVLPQQNEQFPAEGLILALRNAGLKHGKFGIFHRVALDGVERIRYSVASLVEPGSFDLSKLKESSYKGISIFMVLPAPEDGVELFDEMLLTSREIAREIDGRLVDEQGAALSVQRERYMREEVIEFLRRHQNSIDDVA